MFIPKRLIIVAAIIVAAALVIGVYKLSLSSHLFGNTGSSSTGSPYTKGIINKTGSSRSTVQPKTGTSSDTNTPPPSSATNQAHLIAPWGSFANVYNATMGEQMGSTCNTAPGATCQIFFSNGSATQSLPIKTADNGGGAYWSWTPSQIGLSPGIWHIKATATLGSQTSTTNNDPLTLKVSS